MVKPRVWWCEDTARATLQARCWFHDTAKYGFVDPARH